MKVKNIINLTEKDRANLKAIQLELLDEFSRFCIDNNIEFYLFAGTLLGAVRHGGFIPWDDDIDVCMTRENYDKFCGLYKSSDLYFLQNTSTDNNYYYHFSKLLKKGTVYNEYITHRTKCINGIFIDIFPINGVPKKNSGFPYFHYYFWLFVLNKRAYPRTVKGVKKLKRSFSYVLMTILSLLLLWWMPHSLAAKTRDRFMKKHQNKGSGFCISGTNLRRLYSSADFEGKSFVLFEGRQMPAMKDIDSYLTKMYGDYMSLPPIEKRIPHHYLVEFKG